MTPRNVVQILNKDLELVAVVKALMPINDAKTVLRYSKRLSGYGECIFRISTKDPIFERLGDIIEPHKYHVRVMRGNTTVWQGAIIDNPHRTKNYQEVRAMQYLFYLDKVLVERTKEVVAGEGFHYREFNSGTMASAVNNIVTYAKNYFGTNHIMGDLVVNTANIENPNYPKNFTTVAGAALTGAWNFSSDISLMFDYHKVYFVLQSFGIYSNADFTIDSDLTFRYKRFLGTNRQNVQFLYGQRGNVVDYDIPRYGQRMANDLVGIAAQTDGRIIRSTKSDSVSRDTYGNLQDAMPFADAKDQNSLNARVAEELRFLKQPENAPLSFTVNEKAYFLGAYDTGDIISVRVKDGPIDYNAPRRITQFVVNVHETGREVTVVQTNEPRDSDLAA